jgi:hypothetical protein
MPQYDLHIPCSECGNFHDTLLRVSLDESFDVRNLSEMYGKIPLEFSAGHHWANVPNHQKALANGVSTT